MMLTNSPKFRGAIYVVAVAAQVLAFFVRAADPTGTWAEAVQSTANFLGALAGVTAMGNLAVPAPTRLELPQQPNEEQR